MPPSKALPAGLWPGWRRWCGSRLEAGRWARWLVTMCLVALTLAAGPTACQTTQKTATVQTTKPITFSNRWLEDNVQVKVENATTNERSGLYEVDASIETQRLERGRVGGYRVVVRTAFYTGGPENIVDKSAWAEAMLRPGNPVSYHSTSLVPADGCLIELAYPEEVGIE